MVQFLIQLVIFTQVTVAVGARKGVAIVEWEASPAGDVIADSVVALLMHAQSSAASIRLTSKPCRHPRDLELNPRQAPKKLRESTDEDIIICRLRFIHALLREHFENVEATYEGTKATFEIQTDAGLQSDVLDDEGKLSCCVRVEFLDKLGEDAKVSVECRDEKLATSIQECLRSATEAAKPIAL
jgi:hypothetical protein